MSVAKITGWLLTFNTTWFLKPVLPPNMPSGDSSPGTVTMTRRFLPLTIAAIVVVGGVLTLAVRPQAPPSAEAAQLSALPAAWPSVLHIGASDSSNGGTISQPMGFRYQYLAGGVNTGGGWANWNPNGQFATYYIQASSSVVPVFTYYMIAQSSPGNSMGESSGVAANLQNTNTMRAYYDDLKLFFQRAGAFSNRPIVLHVEPDMWGFIQQRASGDNAASVQVSVASSGHSDVTGFADNATGLAQAIVHLRNLYAPNVLLGYHMSTWGTGTDIVYSNPTNAALDGLATKAANFYASLGASFDVSFAEFSDRDAGFKQHIYGDGGASWWDEGDFTRFAQFLGRYSELSQTRIVMWQIPLGNTKMRAMNNTWNHYQDNKVEWFFDDSTGSHLRDYADAGVIAFLFGRGADGATCACDANNDGVTNPAAINGNNRTSLNADDDGGYFKERVAAYYQAGALSLAGGTAPAPTSVPATATPTRTPTPMPATATPTRTPTSVPVAATPTSTAVPPTQTAVPSTQSWTTSAVTAPTTVKRGSRVGITASVRPNVDSTVLVDVEVYAPNGSKVFQTYWDRRSFSANQTRAFSSTWRIPSNAATGNYTVRIGVFGAGWNGLLHWNHSATTFTVTR